MGNNLAHSPPGHEELGLEARAPSVVISWNGDLHEDLLLGGTSDFIMQPSGYLLSRSSS